MNTVTMQLSLKDDGHIPDQSLLTSAQKMTRGGASGKTAKWLRPFTPLADKCLGLSWKVHSVLRFTTAPDFSSRGI